MARSAIARPPGHRRGMTLVEIMVVIGVMVLFLAMAVGGLSAARTEARRVRCAANLGQIGQLMGLYATDRGAQVVPFYGRDQERLDPDDIGPRDAWHVELMALAIGEPDRDRIDVDDPSPESEIFLCPEDTGYAFTRHNLSYGLNADVMDEDGTPYSVDSTADGEADAYYFSDIANPANFILIADSGFDPTVDATDRNYRSWITSPRLRSNDPRPASPMHRQRANVLFGDLHVDAREARMDRGINAPTEAGARPWTLRNR